MSMSISGASFAVALGLFVGLTSPAHAGIDIGSGGDGVECKRTTANAFEGLYMLDYLMTLGPDGQPTIPDVPARRWEDSIARIQRLLSEKYPQIGASFAEFVKDLNNLSDFTRPRIWVPSSNKLQDIKDEGLARVIPANCRGAGEGPTSTQVLQLVIRVERPRLIAYEADYTLLRALERYPIQYSFLLVHEWLRDLTDDPQAIRWANRFLHSQNLDRLTAPAVRESLDRIGLSAGSRKFVSVCNRTPVLRGVFETMVGKSCEAIVENDLRLFRDQMGRTITQLDLKSSGLTSLLGGDFGGVGGISFLNLSQNRIPTLDGSVFQGLKSVNTIKVTESAVKTLTGAFFSDSPGLEKLGFKGNGLTSLPRGLLSGASAPEGVCLDVSDNKLLTIPDDLIRSFGEPGGVYPDRNILINLTNNNLIDLPRNLFEGIPRVRIIKLYIRDNQLSASASQFLTSEAAWLGNLKFDSDRGIGTNCDSAEWNW